MPFDLSSINISDTDIAYAESILLKDWECFDDERRSFIRNLKTIDLQAVPWSWKTTALLAKLLILDKKMPFPDGQGILVLSHTNTAVDELKMKLQNFAPNLFKYPNFIWTIQSFVDEFLAIPFYCNKFWTRPHTINTDIYNDQIDRAMKSCIHWMSQDTYRKVKYIAMSNPELITDFRFSLSASLEVSLISKLNWVLLSINKPWRSRVRNYTDYSESEKISIKQYLKKLKFKLLEDGILSYDDAYFLGNYYIHKHPKSIENIQQRFPIVLIDEMQDMDIHQIEIIEKCFFKPTEPDSLVLQRIWDINQAIYSWEVKSENSWKSRSILLWDTSRLLKIRWSHRLTPEIAKVVSNFGLEYISIEWKKPSCWLKPCLIVFDNDHINSETWGTNRILWKFAEIISLQDFSWVDEKKKKFKAIVWNASPINSGYTLDKCRMQHYFFEYSKTERLVKQSYHFPKDYLKHYDKADITYWSIQKNILWLFSYLLRWQSIIYTDEKWRNRYYNESKILEKISNTDTLKYTEFMNKILELARILKLTWDYQTVYDEIKIFFGSYLIIFGVDLRNILWVDDETEVLIQSWWCNNQIKNHYKEWWIDIEITTVHSVKWETHTATLYMETSYYADRVSLGHESERLKEQFKGNNINPSTPSERIKQSAKMVYVWFSRPTHLLCYAMHKDRFESIWEANLIDSWEINKELIS